MAGDREPVPLVDVTRSGVIECRHRGSVVVAYPDSVVDTIGDPATTTPMRSTAKPFQATALLRRNGEHVFHLTNEELAVMSSSHNGEERHVNVVLRMLEKGGYSDSALACGTHQPYFPWITQAIMRDSGDLSSALHNNCSGKHAGMLLLARLQGTTTAAYTSATHPVQTEIMAGIAEALRIEPGRVDIGVDGCGVPTYNVTLDRLAMLYAAFASATASGEPKELALTGRAWMAEPFMVGGSSRLDTDLMKLKSGLLGKVGSEGIYCIGIPAARMGIAIKVESGCEAAAECVAVDMLVRLGFLSTQEATALTEYWKRPVRTFTNQIVGEYRACF